MSQVFCVGWPQLIFWGPQCKAVIYHQGCVSQPAPKYTCLTKQLKDSGDFIIAEEIFAETSIMIGTWLLTQFTIFLAPNASMYTCCSLWQRKTSCMIVPFFALGVHQCHQHNCSRLTLLLSWSPMLWLWNNPVQTYNCASLLLSPYLILVFASTEPEKEHFFGGVLGECLWPKYPYFKL